MKMTLNDLKIKHKALMEVSQLALPAKIGYAIRYNMDKMEPHIKLVEEERRNICERYARKDEHGRILFDANNNYDISEEDVSLVAQEYMRFLNEETVDISVRKIKDSFLELCDADNRYSIPTIAQIQSIRFMLEEDD